MRRNRKGQVTAETAVLFTFVITGLVFMGMYLQRATQGSMKSNTDGIGSQFSVISTGAAPTSYTQSTQKSYERTLLTGTQTTSDSCNKQSLAVGGAVATDVTTTECEPGKGSNTGFTGMITNAN